MKIHIKSAVPLVLLLIAHIVALFSIEDMRYYDEILGVLALGFLLIAVITRNKIIYSEPIIKGVIISYIILMLLGFLSNINYSVQNSWIDVMIDAFTLIKTATIFVVIIILLKNNEKTTIRLFRNLQIVSKILICILFIFLIIGLIFNTTIAVYDKWSPFPQFKTFLFFTNYPSILSVLISSLISMLLVNYTQNRIFILMGCICIIFTQAGLGLLTICVLGILLLLTNKTKIKWYHILLLFIGGSLAGYTEIREYLLNDTAARSILFRYSIKTANDFFPLGAGFSTYGSAQAAKSYSRLYINYGFLNMWGMGRGTDSFYLNDTYYPMIIGQFGYIGIAVYLLLHYKFFKFFNKSNANKRISLIFLLILILAADAGNGGITSITGVILMSYMAILFCLPEKIQV